MKRKIKGGLTSVSLPIFIQDTSSTTGSGLSGVTHSSSGLVLEYRRRGQSTWTSVTPVTKTLGTYVSGGIVADGALAGAYELDMPDAAFASGVRWVAIRVRGVANMLPVLIEIELDVVDYQDPVRFGLTALPNVESGSAGALLTSGTGTAQLATSSGLVTLAGVTHTGAVIPAVTTVNGLGANAITATAIASDAVSKLQSGLASQGSLQVIGELVDSIDVTAAQIKAKTDLIPAEPASRTNITAATGITVSAIEANVITAASLASDAATEIATAVAATQVLSRLDSMIESNGAGQFRFDTIALELAPSGAAGDPWSTFLPGSYAAGTAGYIVGVSLPRYGHTQRWTSPTNTLDVSISKV